MKTNLKKVPSILQIWKSWPPTDKVGKPCAVQEVSGSPPTSIGLQNSDAFVAMLRKMQEVTSPAMRVVASASPGLD